MVTFCNCLGLQLPARIYVWHDGDLVAFLFSRACTRALSRATHAPPARNTPSSSTVFPHTAAACNETGTDPVTNKDHTSKHPDPLRQRPPSKRRRSAPPCRAASCRPAGAKPCLPVPDCTSHVAKGAAEAGRRRRREPEPSSALASCPQGKRPTLSSTSGPCRSG